MTRISPATDPSLLHYRQRRKWENDNPVHFKFRIRNSSNSKQLHIGGGVSLCGNHTIKNEYHLEEGNQNVDVTLCGNPPPKLSYTLDGEKKGTTHVEKIDDDQKMYKYRIEFKNLKARHCGERIHFDVVGFKEYKTTSTIMLNYKPSKVKDVEAFKEQRSNENCTVLKITDSQGTSQCKMKYIIHLFDADKQPLQYENRQIEVDSLETDRCDNALYKNLYYVNVQAKWKDDKGPSLKILKSVKFRQGGDKEDPEGTNMLVIIVCVVVGLGLIIVVALIVTKKYLKPRGLQQSVEKDALNSEKDV